MEDNIRNNSSDFDNPEEFIVSLKEWVVTLLICFVPFVNIIMLLIWAFGGGTNRSKANFAKAALILVLIYFFMVLIFMNRIMSAFSIFNT